MHLDNTITFDKHDKNIIPLTENKSQPPPKEDGNMGMLHIVDFYQFLEATFFGSSHFRGSTALLRSTL